MNIRYFLAFGLLAGGAAQSAPLANLAMACPDESAIGQDFESCSGYAYQIPTNQLIVVSSSYTWRKAADLAPSDLLAVCTIPVEPGAYSRLQRFRRHSTHGLRSQGQRDHGRSQQRDRVQDRR